MNYLNDINDYNDTNMGSLITDLNNTKNVLVDNEEQKRLKKEKKKLKEKKNRCKN